MPARLLVLLLVLLPTLAAAQQTASAVMLSDIHFDPFHNPSQLAQLRAEPIDRWPAILAVPAAPTDAARLDALQDTCHARALDTAWPLLQTTLIAIHDADAHPTFLTLSGDLLTHDFPCRFTQLAPGATPQDLAVFAARTVSFVIAQLHAAYPHTPLYATLGNNDSGCDDYRETPNDQFLQKTADALRAATLIPALTLTPTGDYSLSLPAPIDRTRLIVLNNIFESRAFTTCAGNADRTAERTQLDWLRTQLEDARTHHEQVWVMAHIPPGVDVLNSFRRYVFQPAALCSASPRPYLADTAFADTLLDYADIIRLTLFGHTHMDEIRVLHRPSSPTMPGHETPSPQTPAAHGTAVAEQPAPSSTGAEAVSQSIPAKLVPSITPFAGNHPAFLVATVDPHTAVLKDWRTVVSPGPQGSAAPWTEAYRFTTAYRLPDFSAASAQTLADAFTADKTGQSPPSGTFRQHFYPGDIGLYAVGLAQIWPAYACSVAHDRSSAVHDCICAALPPSKTEQP